MTSAAPSLQPSARPERELRHALFVGLGGVGQRHLRNLRASFGAGLEISAFRVRGEDRVIDDSLAVVPGRSLVEDYGIEVFADLDAALARGPQVAFITNPSSLHVPIALSAAEAGCDLFLEKPLSSDMHGVERLCEIVERDQLVGMVGYQLRFHPGFRRLQALLAQGALGNVLFARAEVGEYLPAFHPYEDYRRLYAARRELGGGVTLSQIHEIDLIYALFGTPRRVYSLGGKLSSLDIDVDDVSMSLLDFRSPDGRALPVQLHQDFVRRPARRAFSVVGESGSVEWNLAEKRWTAFGAAGEVSEEHDFSTLERNQLFRDELAHFLDCMRSRQKPEIDLRDGVESLRIARALLESQTRGGPVDLATRRRR